MSYYSPRVLLVSTSPFCALPFSDSLKHWSWRLVQVPLAFCCLLASWRTEYQSGLSRKSQRIKQEYLEEQAFRFVSALCWYSLRLINYLKPRTQEVEHFLGVLEDVKKLATGPPTLHVYDQKDTRRLVKTIDFVQDFEPTPAFPIVSIEPLTENFNQLNELLTDSTCSSWTI